MIHLAPEIVHLAPEMDHVAPENCPFIVRKMDHFILEIVNFIHTKLGSMSWFDFSTFYQKLKKRQFVIYPGKVSNHDTFRIGTIGDLNLDDIDRLINVIEETVAAMKSDV